MTLTDTEPAREHLERSLEMHRAMAEHPQDLSRAVGPGEHFGAITAGVDLGAMAFH